MRIQRIKSHNKPLGHSGWVVSTASFSTLFAHLLSLRTYFLALHCLFRYHALLRSLLRLHCSLAQELTHCRAHGTVRDMIRLFILLLLRYETALLSWKINIFCFSLVCGNNISIKFFNIWWSDCELSLSFNHSNQHENCLSTFYGL